VTTAPRPPLSLLGLAWPLIISFTLRSLLTAVDLPYASQLEDPDAAIAAIGLAFPLEFTFIACWVGASSALTSYLSRAMGERDAAKLEQLLRTARSIVVALAALFILGAGGCYAAAPYLDVAPAVRDNFRIYAPILLLGAATVGFWSILPDSLVKAHHDMKTTMLAGLTTGVTNLALNTLFVFGFGWGITGIAIATACGRFGGFLVSWLRCRTLEAARAAEWKDLPAPARPHAPLERPLVALLALAVPSALTYVLMGSENLFANWVLLSYAADEAEATACVAAYAIYHRATLLFLMPVIAVAVAVNPFVARAYGGGQLDQIKRGLRQGYLYALAYGLVFAFPLCLLVGEPLAAFLSKAETTKDLAALAVRYGVPLGVLTAGPFLLARPAFEAVQRGAPGLIMSALRYVVLAVPCGLLGIQLAGSAGHPPLVGLIAGLVSATAVVSLLISGWLLAMVRGLRAEEPNSAPSAG